MTADKPVVPTVLTRTEAETMLRPEWTDKAASEVSKTIARLWPDGVRIVPDPIPEPGPEVDHGLLTKDHFEGIWVFRTRNPFVEDHHAARDWNWSEIAAYLAGGWTLTEYLAKDGAE